MPDYRIKPSLGRIAIRYLQEEEMSAGGIYLPYGREISCAGEVVATCEPYEAASDDMDTKAPAGPLFRVGDTVVVGKYSGIEVTIGRASRDKVLIINESDVLAILEEIPDAET